MSDDQVDSWFDDEGGDGDRPMNPNAPNRGPNNPQQGINNPHAAPRMINPGVMSPQGNPRPMVQPGHAQPNTQMIPNQTGSINPPSSSYTGHVPTASLASGNTCGLSGIGAGAVKGTKVVSGLNAVPYSAPPVQSRPPITVGTTGLSGINTTIIAGKTGTIGLGGAQQGLGGVQQRPVGTTGLSGVNTQQGLSGVQQGLGGGVQQGLSGLTPVGGVIKPPASGGLGGIGSSTTTTTSGAQPVRVAPSTSKACHPPPSKKQMLSETGASKHKAADGSNLNGGDDDDDEDEDLFAGELATGPSFEPIRHGSVKMTPEDLSKEQKKDEMRRVPNAHVVRYKAKLACDRLKMSLGKQVADALTLALQSRLETIMEEVVALSKRRIDPEKETLPFVVSSNPRLYFSELEKWQRDQRELRANEKMNGIESSQTGNTGHNGGGQSGGPTAATIAAAAASSANDALAASLTRKMEEETGRTAFHFASMNRPSLATTASDLVAKQQLQQQQQLQAKQVKDAMEGIVESTSSCNASSVPSIMSVKDRLRKITATEMSLWMMTDPKVKHLALAWKSTAGLKPPDSVPMPATELPRPAPSSTPAYHHPHHNNQTPSSQANTTSYQATVSSSPYYAPRANPGGAVINPSTTNNNNAYSGTISNATLHAKGTSSVSPAINKPVQAYTKSEPVVNTPSGLPSGATPTASIRTPTNTTTNNNNNPTSRPPSMGVNYNSGPSNVQRGVTAPGMPVSTIPGSATSSQPVSTTAYLGNTGAKPSPAPPVSASPKGGQLPPVQTAKATTAVNSTMVGGQSRPHVIAPPPSSSRPGPAPPASRPPPK